MAIPTLVAGSMSSGTGDVTPTLVAHQADDVIGVVIESNFDQAPATPSGWTQFSASPMAGASGTRLTVFGKIAASSSETPPLLTDPGDHQIVTTFRVRGAVSGGVMLIDNQTQQTAGGSTSITWTGFTTTHDDVLLVYLASRGADTAGAVVSAFSNAGSVANLTEVFDDGAIDGGGGGLFIGTGELATAGATGNTSATITAAQVTCRITIAFFGAPEDVTGSLLDMTIPAASPTATLIAIVARDAEAYCSDPSWLKVVDGLGTGDKFLDAWIHLGEGLVEGDTLSFLSLTEQEMQGGFLVASNLAYETIIEASAHDDFASVTDAPAPIADSLQEDNTYVCGWFTSSDVVWTPPPGFTTIDTYSSSVIDPTSSLLLGYRVSRDIVGDDPGDATASAPVSGRAWTLVLRFEAPLVAPAGQYWGPMFPDYAGATFTIDAVAASLALGNPLTSFDGPMEHLTARARLAGSTGNDITIEFSDDALTTSGDVEEDTTARTVHVKFVDGITTSGEIVALVNSASSLVEIVGTYSASDLFHSGDDEFPPTTLEGGVDARTGTLARYWGPHFPDGADEDAPAVTPIGPEAVATLALALDKGASVTFTWATDVIKSYSGIERRATVLEDPKQSYDGQALLLGDETRQARNQLARYAALGRPFLLGLPYEETTLTEDSVGYVVTVQTADSLDWANPGQRVIVKRGAGADVSTHEAVISSVDGDEITLDDVDPLVCVSGARIMPAMAVLFEPQQGFARYRTADGAERWAVKAQAALFGFPSAATSAELAIGNPVTASGALDGAIVRARTPGAAGNSITVQFSDDALSGTDLEEDTTALTVNVKFTASVSTVRDVRDVLATSSSLVRLTDDGTGLDLDASLAADDDEFGPTALAGGADESPTAMGRSAELTTFNGRPIWDRGVDNADTIDDSIQSLSELVDMGGIPIGIGAAEVPDWGRRLALVTRRGAEWQWLKLFLFTIRGRWKAFYLPTYRSDLTPLSLGPDGGTEGEFVIDANIGDFDLWFSRGYFLLQIVQGGVTYYAEITNSNNNGDDTLTLTVQVDTSDPSNEIPSEGTIERISWCELCRLEEDEITVQFGATTFSMSTVARVVQQ